MVFPLTSKTVGRPPGTCGPGAALGVLRIVKNASTAVGTSFAARRLGKMITMRNFNYSTRTSIFPILEEPRCWYRPAPEASASCHFAFACWAWGWCAFARCPLTRPLQPRRILLLGSLEGSFFPWPPKTTDEPNSYPLFSVQGERESHPFSGKLPETLNDLFR